MCESISSKKSTPPLLATDVHKKPRLFRPIIRYHSYITVFGGIRLFALRPVRGMGKLRVWKLRFNNVAAMPNKHRDKNAKPVIIEKTEEELLAAIECNHADVTTRHDFFAKNPNPNHGKRFFRSDLIQNGA